MASSSDTSTAHSWEGKYDALPNLAILKLFQLNPSEFDYDTAILILVKALTTVPFPDFSLCISLLGEAPVATLTASDAAKSTGASGNITDPIIMNLAALSTLLFETKFRDFWALYHSDVCKDVRAYTNKAVGFEDDVRKVALNSVKGSFRTISEVRLSGYLNLKGIELAQFIEKQPGWSLNNGTVAVPANLDNEVKPTVMREEISLDSRCLEKLTSDLSKLLAQA